MQLTSVAFLFSFLPLIFILFISLKNSTYRKFILVFFSIAFYAWGDFASLLLMSLLTIYVWIAGKSIKNLNDKGEINNFYPSILITLIFIPLIFYKTIEALDLNLFPNYPLLLQPKLPLGLSFITFSAASYLIDINHDEMEPETDFINLALYIFMFPKVLQGPITKYQEIQENIHNPKTNIENISKGTQRFIIGLGKKVLLADSLSIAILSITNIDFIQLTSTSAWFGLLFFSLQIFIDFSAYTDMAIGLGKIFGFNFPENFNFPYASISLTDFWRRWHITLVSWFRQYLFYSLEITQRKSKFLRQQINILIVFLATGLWHGFTLNFIFWGLYNGIILGLESLFIKKLLVKTPRIIQHIYTLALIIFGWLFFMTDSPKTFFSYLSTLFIKKSGSIQYSPQGLNIITFIPIAVISLFLCFPILKKIPKKDFRAFTILNSFGYLLILLLSIAVIIKGGFKAFLYAGF